MRKPRQDPFVAFQGDWNPSGVTMGKLPLPPPEPGIPEVLALGLDTVKVASYLNALRPWEPDL